MSNESIPSVPCYIANMQNRMYTYQIFPKLEDLLKKSKARCEAKDQLQKSVNNSSVDVMVVREAAHIMQEQRENSRNCVNILNIIYYSLHELVRFLDDDVVKSVLGLMIFRKQNDVQDKLNLIKELKKKDSERNAVLERRKVVKDFRIWQSFLKQAREYSNFELENQQLKHLGNIEIWRASQQRNEEIVSLIQIRRKIGDLNAILLLKIPYSCLSSIYRRDFDKRSVVFQYRNNSITLQSAVDFLTKKLENSYELAAKRNDGITYIESMGSPLRSILLANRYHVGSIDSEVVTKQVHFAPLSSAFLIDENSVSSFEVIIKKKENQFSSNILNFQSSLENITNTRVISTEETLNMLPQLNLSFDGDTDVSPASSLVDSANSMTKRSLTHFLSSNDSIQNEDLVQNIELKRVIKQPQLTTLKSNTQSFSSSKDRRFEYTDTKETSSFSFLHPTGDTHNGFFFNFSDGCSTVPQDISRAYNL